MMALRGVKITFSIIVEPLATSYNNRISGRRCQSGKRQIMPRRDNCAAGRAHSSLSDPCMSSGSISQSGAGSVSQAPGRGVRRPAEECRSQRRFGLSDRLGVAGEAPQENGGLPQPSPPGAGRSSSAGLMADALMTAQGKPGSCARLTGEG